MPKNSGSVIKVASSDKKALTALGEMEVDSSMIGNKPNLYIFTRSNHSKEIKQNFAILEYRDASGYIHIYKIESDKSLHIDEISKEFTTSEFSMQHFILSPDDSLDINMRKILFGEMSYNFEKPVYYCKKQILDSTEILFKFLSKVYKGDISNIQFSSETSHMGSAGLNSKSSSSGEESLKKLVSFFEEQGMLDSELSLSLNGGMKGYIQDETTLKLGKKQLLHLTGRDEEDYNRDEMAIKTYLVVEDKLIKNAEAIESLVRQENLSRRERNEIERIEKDPYMNSFYTSLRHKLGGTYLASSSISTGMVENKKTGITGHIGNLTKKAGEFTPLVGVGVKLIGEVLNEVDKKLEARKVDRFAKLVVDGTEMSELAEKLARKIVISELKLNAPEENVLKRIGKFLIKKASKASEGDLSLSEAMEEIKGIKENAVELAVEKVKEKAVEQATNYLDVDQQLSKYKEREAAFEKKGVKDAELAAKIILMLIYGGKLDGMNMSVSLDKKVESLFKYIKAEYTEQGTDIGEDYPEEVGQENFAANIDETTKHETSFVSEQPGSSRAAGKKSYIPKDKASMVAYDLLEKIKLSLDPNIRWFENQSLEKTFVKDLAYKIKQYYPSDSELIQVEPFLAEALSSSSKLKETIIYGSTGCCSSSDAALNNHFIQQEGFFSDVMEGVQEQIKQSMEKILCQRRENASYISEHFEQMHQLNPMPYSQSGHEGINMDALGTTSTPKDAETASIY